MRYIYLIHILLLSFIYSSCSSLNEDQVYIRDYMQSRGIQIDATHYQKVYSGDGISVFSNEKDHQFAVLADGKYDTTLSGNRILAFSNEASWALDLPMDKMLGYYEQTLQLAFQQQVTIPDTDYKLLIPSLLNTSWGQKKPYNKDCPEGMMAGCVPVAMAQIINLHQPAESASKLIAELGEMARTHYTPKNSVTNTLHIKPTLMHKGFMPQCRYLSNLNRKDVQQICREDLEKGMPLLLSNGDHAFVCDGQWGDYLHFVLGWNGFFDGYYRLLPADGLSWEPVINSSMVCHIQLNNQSPMHREVELKSAGTLALELGNDSLSINTLVLSGPVNGADMALVRRMAGAASKNTESIGNLTFLDISRARFQTGSIYRTVDAKATGYLYRKGLDVFDFKQMTPQRWQRFCKLGYNRRPGYLIEQAEDGRYLVHFTLKEVADKNLLIGCDNLKF